MAPPTPRTLLVAALWGEALPLLRRLQNPERLTRGLVAGSWKAHPVAIARVGVGAQPAEEGTRRAVQLYQPDRIVSVGTCGALVDDLEPGCVVAACGLLGAGARDLQPMPAPRSALLATVPRAVNRPELRQRWAATGAQVCEMEAAGVLAAAGERPCHALKVVSDMAGASGRRSRLPRRLRLPAFQLHALWLVERRLAPALEGALAALSLEP